MNKSIIILLMAVLLIIPFSLATTDEIRFIGKQNTEINLTESCWNNNTYCSTGALCNITIKDPHQNVIISNREMANFYAYHIFNLKTNETSNLGVHEATVYCKDGTYNGYETFYYKVTTDGRDSSTGEGIGIIVGLVGIIFFFIYLCTKIDDQYHGIKLFLTTLSLIFIVPILYIAKLTADNGGNELTANIINLIYMGYLPFIIFYLIYIILMFTIWLLRALIKIGKHKEVDDDVPD